MIMSSFPEFCATGKIMDYVTSFKYLGHIISSNNNDDADIQSEVSNMFIRTKILSRKFHKCSLAVKSVLFRSYCICMHDVASWSIYHVDILNKLRSSYSRCRPLFLIWL